MEEKSCCQGSSGYVSFTASQKLYHHWTAYIATCNFVNELYVHCISIKVLTTLLNFRSAKGKVKGFNVKSKYKNMSTRYNKSPYTSWVVFHSTPLKRNTISNISDITKKEAHKLCTTKHGASILHDIKALASFSWCRVVDELKSAALDF